MKTIHYVIIASLLGMWLTYGVGYDNGKAKEIQRCLEVIGAGNVGNPFED